MRYRDSLKWTAVLAPLAVALFLASCTTAAQAQSTGGASAPAASPDPGKVWLKIMAFTNVPVVGADVRVSVHGSQGRPLVDVHAATNRYGVFPVAVPSHPSFFRVTISGGTINGEPFLWHLMADVELTDPAHQILVINPVTTLVGLVLDERPDLKLDGAEARVRTFLKLPANYPLGMALRQNSGYVSPFLSVVAFMTEAQAAGGLDAFEHLLLQELASESATHSFRQPHLLGSTTSFVAEGLAKGALSYAGGEATGWIMQSTGLTIPGSDSSEIDALLDALAQLQSEIENLSYQVAQLTQLVQSTATQTQFNTIVVPAQALAVQVNGVESDLVYFANACPPLPDDGSTPTPPDAFCTNQKSSVNAELNDVTIQQAYVTMESYVADNPTTGFRGMLHLYSLWLAQSRAFFRAADSTKMQNLYDYWDAALTQAANLKVELLHENGAQDNPGGQQQLIDFLGNPDLNPPTTGTFQANQTANLKLMGSAVPEGTVVSTVGHHLMWSLLPFQPDPQYSGYNFSPPAIYPGAGCWNSGFPFTGYLYRPYAGFTHWAPGALNMYWNELVQLAPPLSSGQNWQQWLTAETKTTGDETPASDGWFNSLSCTNPVVAIWTGEGGGSSYWVIHLDHDNFSTTGTGSGAHNQEWPARYLADGEFYFWSN